MDHESLGFEKAIFERLVSTMIALILGSGVRHLDWRTFHRAKTAKDATIPIAGMEYPQAVFAFVKELAVIDRHDLSFRRVAMRASYF